MNKEIRKYLIDRAKIKAPVSYGTIMQQLELDNSNPEHRNILSYELAEISRLEHSKNRPLLSSIAMYEGLRNFGPGFYPLAEELGFGDAHQLEQRGFAFEMQKTCFEFWRNADHVRQFSDDINRIEVIPTSLKSKPFFIMEELDFFKKWQLQVYDSENKIHVEAKNYIMSTVWEKSIHLGNLIVNKLPEYFLEAKKTWSKLGSKEEGGKKSHAPQFKAYTWVKIYKGVDRGKQIFFTFGIDAYPETESFVYKIDCQRERGTALTEAQIILCDSLIPSSAKWNEISFTNLLEFNWDSLTSKCIDFIQEHEKQYDAIISAVSGGSIPAELFKNTLAWRDKPKDGYENVPENKKSFKGFDIDFLKKTQEQIDLGDAGENLVKQEEIKYLNKLHLLDLACKVEIAKDGEGYDVLSFDENGKEKFIEVKTTMAGEYTPFYLSDNEIEFMRIKKGQYSVYRIYNYDAANNFGECFEITGDVESQVLMKPSVYKVLLKKE